MTSTQEARSDGLRRVGVRCLIIQCRTEHCLLFSRAVNKTAGIPYSKGKETFQKESSVEDKGVKGLWDGLTFYLQFWPVGLLANW